MGRREDSHYYRGRKFLSLSVITRLTILTARSRRKEVTKLSDLQVYMDGWTQVANIRRGSLFGTYTDKLSYLGLLAEISTRSYITRRSREAEIGVLHRWTHLDTHSRTVRSRMWASGARRSLELIKERPRILSDIVWTGFVRILQASSVSPLQSFSFFGWWAQTTAISSSL